MAKETPREQATVARVMHEFKEGQLKRPDGGVVKSRKQAVAIGLSEAGVSDRVAPAVNRRNRARTQAADGERTKDALMAQARSLDIKGRSSMTKAQLLAAIHKA